MTTAVIVAAGAGKRLGPLGASISKPMVEVAGRPLITWVIERLRQAGVERIIAVVHPDNSALQALLGEQDPPVTWTIQTERRGMAHAVAQALPLIDTAAYLACACDSLFLAADIRALIDAGNRHPGDAVIGVLEMGQAATASRSAVVIEDGRVLAIHEKPKPGTVASGLVGMPLYWLPRSLDGLLRHDPEPDAEWQVAEALAQALASGETLWAVSVRERLEVTTPADIECVSLALKSA